MSYAMYLDELLNQVLSGVSTHQAFKFVWISNEIHMLQFQSDRAGVTHAYPLYYEI